MSALVDRAIEGAGLGRILQARRDRDVVFVHELQDRLAHVDLLPLGALADRVRAEEVGNEVRIYANLRSEGDAAAVQIRPDPAEIAGLGLGVLRRSALARITGPHAARIRIDWAEVGLELAQVALGFGVNELSGPLSNRRGLPIADDERVRLRGAGLVSLQSLKQRELAALVERAGRTPVFVDERVVAQRVSPEVDHA